MKHLSRRDWLKICGSLGGASMLPFKSHAAPLELRSDDIVDKLAPRLASGSHVKLYVPSLPYIYTSHAINAGLLRPANNEKGWEYDLATDIKKIDDKTYEVVIREGVRFQDGSPFLAESVYANVRAFLKQPFLFSKLHETLIGVDVIGKNRVRFYLNQRYGQFMNDLLWLHFYSPDYLSKYGWNGKATCPNLAEPGPYGLGPYVLTEGYAEGDRQTPKLVLKANPYYWREGEPHVETITVFTELDSQSAISQVQNVEGGIDITPIPFHEKIQSLRAPHSKVAIAESNSNFALYMNMRNGNKALLDKKVRLALNQAINQKNLLTFVYMDEGKAKAATASPNFPRFDEIYQNLRPYSEQLNPYDKQTREELKSVLEGLTLKVFTQRNFLWLWRGIAYQLGQVGVTLDIDVTDSEKTLFAQLLSTNQRQNTKEWDLLSCGLDDWYFNHPWSIFLAYRTSSVWSTISPDPVLDGYIEELFAATVSSDEYVAVSEKIMRHVHSSGYMLFVPAPNQVIALNKEVSYQPYPMATLPLWQVKVSQHHWSVRQGELPAQRRSPINIART